QLGRISKFGLLEMSRQRLRASLGESSQIVCPRCEGHGRMRSVESLSLSIIRVAEEHAMKDNTGQVLVQAPVEIANFLLNEKRGALAEIEKRHEAPIVIVADEQLQTPHYEVTRLRENELGEESSRPSYQRGTPRKVATIKLSKDNLNIPPPAVTNVRPAQPAPVREPQPEPVPAPVAAATAAVPVANVVPAPANGGLFGWVKRIFVGEPAVAAAPAAKAAQEPQLNDRGSRHASRRDQRNGGKSQGGRDQSSRREREPAAQGQSQQQKDRQGQRGAQAPGGKPSQQPQPQQKKPQPQKQDKPAQQQQQKPQPKVAAEPVEPIAQAAAIAPVVETVTPAVEAVRIEAPKADAPAQDAALAAEAAVPPAQAGEGDAVASDAGQDGNGRRRRGRRGGRRRRRGAGEGAALSADGSHDDLQDDEGDEEIGETAASESRPATPFAQRSQPEFDFDDASDGAAAHAPAATPERERPQPTAVQAPVAPALPVAAIAAPVEAPATVAATDIPADAAPFVQPVEAATIAPDAHSFVVSPEETPAPVATAAVETKDDDFALEAQAATFAAHIPVGSDEIVTPPAVEAAAQPLQLDAAPGLFDLPPLAKAETAEEASPAAEAADTLASANHGEEEARDPDRQDDGTATRSA
nr:ribonuclease E/G [Luteimonas sp.]